MYSKMNTQSGAAFAAHEVSNFGVINDPTDGLTVDTAKLAFPATAVMPDRLFEWLTGLRLLRNIPIDYLVPDSALLPAESIRFFHVDETWVDRVIDGVFSAANTGTVDITYSVTMLESVRATLDQALEQMAQDQVAGSKWTPVNGMTGMLIRSELVRRWPDVIVRAYAGDDETTVAMPVLRAEPISKDLYIAIFAGTPSLVQLREPHVGVRFGVEVDPKDASLKTYYVEHRDVNGNIVNTANSANEEHITFPLLNGRVVPAKEKIAAFSGVGDTSRMVAIQLMRPPFVQQFGNIINEKFGNKTVQSVQAESSGYNPNPPVHIAFGPLRFASMASLAFRAASLERLGKN